MTVGELLALLEDMDEDAEVRIATQPSWPLAFHLGGVAEGADAADEDEMRNDPAPVVWLVAGGSPSDSPYAPSAAWEVATR
jgi:hypothetical protein